MATCVRCEPNQIDESNLAVFSFSFSLHFHFCFTFSLLLVPCKENNFYFFPGLLLLLFYKFAISHTRGIRILLVIHSLNMFSQYYSLPSHYFLLDLPI